MRAVNLRLAGRTFRIGLLTLTLGIIALSATAAIAGIKVTSTPSFCSTCHEMTPEFATWKASAHQKVACVSCHIEPGPVNFLKHKISALNQVRQHIAKSYRLPIEIPHEIKNEVCLQCHSANREASPSGDIKIPHDKHLEKGVTCVTCHKGVAHGQIAEREQTIDGDFKRWTMPVGRSQLVRKFRTMDMKGCQECHEAEKAPLKCEACHNQIVKPKDHQKTAWEQDHGALARRNIKTCDRCHSTTRAMVRAPAENSIAEYARSNTFCQACHVKKPAGHLGEWRESHAAVFGPDKDLTPCQTCHDTKRSRPTELAAKTTCNQCHTAGHQPNWQLWHPVKVGSGVKVGAACVSCHSRQTCGKCHIVRQAAVSQALVR